jgi:hypothetical protein
VTADLRGEGVHDLADCRREDIHAADDQHVVGSPDATDARAFPAARARARHDGDVVSRAEAQKRGGSVPEVREHELALGAVLELARLAGLGVD